MNSKSKSLLAVVLAIALVTSACSARWINIALQDLPVLTQMALNIATLVSTLAAGKQANSGDVAVIQNISAQASRDLNLLQSLYAEYKASPSATTLQKIQNVISDLNQNLPALLESAHISNPTLAARITAAVNLVLTTVNNFAALMPQNAATTTTMSPRIRQSAPSSADALQPPTPQNLKKQWNQQVCTTTGNPLFDAGLNNCAIR
jgi:hypothetical protein